MHVKSFKNFHKRISQECILMHFKTLDSQSKHQRPELWKDQQPRTRTEPPSRTKPGSPATGTGYCTAETRHRRVPGPVSAGQPEVQRARGARDRAPQHRLAGRARQRPQHRYLSLGPGSAARAARKALGDNGGEGERRLPAWRAWDRAAEAPRTPPLPAPCRPDVPQPRARRSSQVVRARPGSHRVSAPPRPRLGATAHVRERNAARPPSQ